MLTPSLVIVAAQLAPAPHLIIKEIGSKSTELLKFAPWPIFAEMTDTGHRDKSRWITRVIIYPDIAT